MLKFYPLKGSFMLFSILGFFVSVIWVYDKFSRSWGFAFALLFTLMFVASLISMTYAPTPET
jgi:hypothetical protein